MTIEIKDFSVTPLQAKTGDKISVEAILNCTNWVYKCNPISITIKVNGQIVKSDTFQPPYIDWSGTPYTASFPMPTQNAYVDVVFQEDNTVSRQASIINTSPTDAPPGGGWMGWDGDTTFNPMQYAPYVVAGVLLLGGYFLLKETNIIPNMRQALKDRLK